MSRAAASAAATADALLAWLGTQARSDAAAAPAERVAAFHQAWWIFVAIVMLGLFPKLAALVSVMPRPVLLVGLWAIPRHEPPRDARAGRIDRPGIAFQPNTALTTSTVIFGARWR